MGSMADSTFLRHRRPGASAVTALQETDTVWFWTVAVLLTLLVSLPVLFFYLRTPQGHIYNGYFLGTDDYFSYLEKMREGWRGSWGFVNRFTLETNRPAFIFGFYLLLGHLCRWLHLPLWAGYHLSRAVLFPLALHAIWTFLGTQVRHPWQRRWGLLLAFGLSSIGLLVDSGSFLALPDMHLGEHLYLAAFYPHYLIDGIALCWTLVLFQRYLAAPNWRLVALAGLCLWSTGLVHPYMVLTNLAVPAVYAVLFRRDVSWRAACWSVAVGVIVAPVMLYMAWALFTDPALAAWRSQSLTRAMSPLQQLIWFGLGSFAAIYGAWRILRGPERMAALSCIWLGVDIVLIDSRIIGNAMEFSIFMGVPAAVLVVYGLEPLRERWRKPAAAGLFKAAVILGMSLSCLMSEVAAFGVPFTLSADEGDATRYYFSSGYWGAMEYLAAHSTAGTVVLSSYTAANQVPAYTDARVYVGHVAETLNFTAKYRRAKALYAGEMPPEEARSFLREQRVDYVLADTYNRYNIYDKDPAVWVADLSRYRNFLEPVYTASDAVVYRFTG